MVRKGLDQSMSESNVRLDPLGGESGSERWTIAGIQFAARRDNLVSIVSSSKSWTTGADVKRSRSLKQLTLTTACVPAVSSEIAAMKTPQRRQIKKSQLRVPKR